VQKRLLGTPQKRTVTHQAATLTVQPQTAASFGSRMSYRLHRSSSGTLSVLFYGTVGTPTREEQGATLTSRVLVPDNSHTAALVVALGVSAHKRRAR
jgi:hypothetical protein